jgi:hypothetical protein
MEVTYGQSDVKNLVYSDIIKPLSTIKVEKKKHERRFNDSMKLLIAEINFITLYVEKHDKDIRIIYMGCSPGFHLVKLLKMYPFIKFDLYDNQPLHLDLERYVLENGDQVSFYNEYLLPETCERYIGSDDHIYLITDHREVKYMKDPLFINDNEGKIQWQIEKEKSYMRDMELQKEICIILKPIYACLRFRPPHYYSSGDLQDDEEKKPIFEYFSGVAWLMIFNDYKSTESRLVVNDFTNTSYGWNYQKYQYRLNRFNEDIRESLLLNPLTKNTNPLPNSLGNKFEPVIMIQVIINYMLSIGISDIRLQSLMKFYEKFMVLEYCSDIDGMYSGCTFDNVNIENNDDNIGGVCDYIDDSLQLID